jgi:hypothetical protein
MSVQYFLDAIGWNTDELEEPFPGSRFYQIQNSNPLEDRRSVSKSKVNVEAWDADAWARLEIAEAAELSVYSRSGRTR